MSACYETSATRGYAGWGRGHPESTGRVNCLVGARPNAVRYPRGTMTIAYPQVHAYTGGVVSVAFDKKVSRTDEYLPQGTASDQEQHVRTPSEDLSRIRAVMKPAISDLATVCGVSRQSVYNWLNGEPVAEENATKLRELAAAADLLEDRGIAFNASLLRRRFADGQTLLQVAQAGGKVVDAAAKLARILGREALQRERMVARAAGRPVTAGTADFDLPPPGDG